MTRNVDSACAPADDGSDHSSRALVTTDVLIVGAGPAGAGLAAFLAQNGVKGIMISRSGSTVKTPRAHYTNPATMECFRDLGLEYEVRRIAHSGKEMGGNIRQCETYLGKELLRDLGIYSSSPAKMGEHWESTPCDGVDLPQTDCEPILIRHATQLGFHFRYSTEFLRFEDHGDHVISYLQDRVTMHEYRVKSRFLCGADGAKSIIATQLGLPFTTGEGGGFALNVFFDADLSRVMNDNHQGNLHVLHGNEFDRPDFGMLGILRIIRPWNKWIMILVAAPWLTEVKYTEEEVVARTKQLLGYDPPDFNLLSISQWKINEEYATEVSKGNVFCLGDAIHRHPPHNGLGSNTCIQDGYNLAWKMAHVLRNQASPSLLETYNIERAPVAKQIVLRANDTNRAQLRLWTHMGTLEPLPEQRKARLALRTEASNEGREYRRLLKQLHIEIRCESQGTGTEYNQQYTSSPAVYTADEPGGPPPFALNPHYYYQRSTYPGFRVPHAWLSVKKQGPLISTQDLVGKTGFTIITGIGGKDKWSKAAERVGASLPGGMKIKVASIGAEEDYEDMYWLWDNIRGVEEDGAVLVRPDRFVGWRCPTVEGKSAEEVEGALGRAMRGILGLGEAAVESRLPIIRG